MNRESCQVIFASGLTIAKTTLFDSNSLPKSASSVHTMLVSIFAGWFTSPILATYLRGIRYMLFLLLTSANFVIRSVRFSSVLFAALLNISALSAVLHSRCVTFFLCAIKKRSFRKSLVLL